MTNPDGTISIVQVDPNNPVITLPDGTTAHVSIKLKEGHGNWGEVLCTYINCLFFMHYFVRWNFVGPAVS